MAAAAATLSDGGGVHVWLVLWKAAQAVESYATRSIGDLELCGSDFAILEALLHKGALPINEIGKKVLLTSGSLTAAVDRLAAKGLAERRASPDDRRAKIIHLTKEGRKLITRAYAAHAADMARLGAVLSDPERATLIRLLKKLGYQAAAELEREAGAEAEEEAASASWAKVRERGRRK